MITFQPVTDEAALRLVDYLAGQPYRSCDYTIGAIYQWRAYFASAVAFVGPVAVLRADYPFPEDGHSYMFPIGGGGSAAIEAALDAVEEYTAALGIPLRYCAVPEAGAAVLRARYGARAVCTAHRDWADYLYMLDDLKTFPGKRFHGQRNHLNRFYKDNPGSRYVPITWMTLPRARAFLTEYVYRTPARSPIEAEEQCRAQELLEAGVLNSYGFMYDPILVRDGAIVESVASSRIKGNNPRTGIGMVKGSRKKERGWTVSVLSLIHI